MSELITQLGVDWRLLLAQVVNFLLLLWVLKRFVFGPLQAFLAKRAQNIREGLDNAAKAEQERQELRSLRDQITKKAHKEAERILQEARQKGAGEYETLMKRAEEKVRGLAEKAKRELAQEKEKMMQEAKHDLASLVVMATQRLIGQKMDETKDKELIDKTLREIK